MNRVVVINVVGLTAKQLGPHSPNISSFAKTHGVRSIRPAFPAVTCTAQSDYVTGKTASQHGIVANGWYNHELSEVQFWKQSNHVVQAPKIWDELKARDPSFTCAKVFWWYNMYASVDYSITPRPMYPADGRKFFDVYSGPASIRTEIKKELGEFPFAGFWGPAAGVKSPQGPRDAATRWIAESAKWIEKKYQPTLSLVYLPHLDYNFQRFGPNDPRVSQDIQEVDAIVGDLLTFYQERGITPVLLSEYGITPVNQAIHINRILRENGWVTIKEEMGLELLDAGASEVFAVADHQVAHVYVKNKAMLETVRKVLAKIPGIDAVLGENEKASYGILHERAGDLIAVSKENAWFTYYYWNDDAKAPDFARCVDIHRKPGYDPVELFLNPDIPMVKAKIAFRLLQKKLGFRMLMDVIPLNSNLVKGSHGCRPNDQKDWPILIGQQQGTTLESTDVYNIIKKAVVGE